MSSTAQEPTKKLTRKDFDPGIDVRWCPGCGDYAILAGIQRTLPTFNIPKEKIVFISGIGCSSRFPYYMNTYGFHTIHGRAPAFATGLKIHRPDLHVWVITGDGDGLSIGGNHLIHTIRRNIDLNIVLFNNRIYGLTKGQYSPTSEVGKVAKSTPMGSIDEPFNPVSLVLGAESAFVARAIDTEAKLLQKVLTAAQGHRGTSFVEVYQNCNVFNDNAFVHFTERKVKEDMQLVLEHGEPMIFGKNKDKGIVMRDGQLMVGTLGVDGVSESDILVHDETLADPSIAFWLSRFEPPDFPVVVGVLRNVPRPSYDEGMVAQIEVAKEKKGPGDLKELIYGNDTWTVD
jgi:2-oxoglutarate/2-oxoacid ferredoxin oxidoreductase subunit beta